jgi:hypothetical protein
MGKFQIRRADNNDCAWVASLLEKRWGSTLIVTRGKSHQADKLPALIADSDSEPIGLITYTIENAEMEIISLNCQFEGIGIGSRLIEAARNVRYLLIAIDFGSSPPMTICGPCTFIRKEVSISRRFILEHSRIRENLSRKYRFWE